MLTLGGAWWDPGLVGHYVSTSKNGQRPSCTYLDLGLIEEPF